MKKSVIFFIILLLITFVNCRSDKSKNNPSNSTVDFKIESSYLLLPIEEKAKEVKMTVQYNDNEPVSAFFLRLAENKIDYWVKIDVKKYFGKTITLRFEGVESSLLGINSIKQSDKFEFEYAEKFRPGFHFTPEYGWMNDPNGMVFLDGEYHLFYQYNPYGTMWGNMHWGHAVSMDMTSWTYLPTAIAPDSLGDIFSGSTVIDVNNTAGFGKNAMIAIYTSNGKIQQQSIAYSTDKGRTFTKYAHNPVLPNPGITDFRDPKVSWNDISNQWIMTLATKSTITFYGSPNLKEWTRLSEFSNEKGAHGGVWECPDLFPLTYEGKTKWVLLVSINPGGPNGGSATQYFIGDFDGKTFTSDSLPYPLWIDYGRDNYAGVTFCNIPQNDGRRLFMGWMSNWDYANNVPTKNFRSAMTVARELTLKNNGEHLVLSSFPAKEVSKLRAKENVVSNQMITKEKSISGLLKDYNGQFEIEMTIDRQNAKIFGFGLTNSNSDYINYTFDLEQNILKVDRRNCGIKDFNQKFASEPIAPLAKRDTYKIRLLVDKASTELFINDGEIVSTNIIFPTGGYEDLTFFTPNHSWKAENIKIYEIK
ncbi:MAG: GH32 C-terminal domain-containing protein [Paludibacter sp.]|nr:GH32 C-terminal domain-containing protein [Paludibacter sp.]